MVRRPFLSNVALNLAASVAPAVAATLVIPSLVVMLGPERLGLLNLAWVLTGTFALLDLGVGRAVTLDTARLLAAGRSDEIHGLARSAVGFLAVVGAVGALVMAFGALNAERWLHSSPALDGEMRGALLMLSLGLPLVTVASGLRAVVEAHGRFDHSGAVRGAMGVATYLGPWAAVQAVDSLVVAVATIVVARLLGLAAFYWSARRVVGARPKGEANGRPALTAVLVNSGWMTVTSLAAAAHGVVDRFVLGAHVSLAAVAYYSTPQELVGKLTVIPMAISAVLFPALGAAAAGGGDLPELFARGMRLTFALLLPVAATAAAAAPEWLGVWLGPAFSEASYRVTQLLCLSVLLQSLAVTPMNLLQAAGRVPLTARLQVIQLPIFVACLWAAARTYGTVGVATVLVLRLGCDLALLLGAASRHSAGLAAAVRAFAPYLAVTLVWFGLLTFVEPFQARAVMFGMGMALFAWTLPPLLGGDWQRLRAAAVRGRSRG